MANEIPELVPGAIRKPEVAEYLKIRRLSGWIIITLVAIGIPFLSSHHQAISFLLLGIAVAYNSCLYLWICIKRSWAVSKQSILLVDSLLLLLLIVYSDGGTASPYTSLLLFPIIASAIWFGVTVSLAVDMGALLAIGVWQLATVTTEVWSDVAKSFGFLMVIFMVIGALAAKLTYHNRRQRLDSLDKDLQINLERQQLLALINNIGDAVIIVDQSGNISMFNEMTAKLTGSQYALVGQAISTVFPMTDNNDKPVDLLATTTATTLRRRDLKMQLKDSSIVNIEADISPYIVNQRSHGFIVILRDITKEKTIEQEQEEFIAVASHELRTPLTIVEANISNALASSNGPKDESVRNMLNQAAHNIMFLSNIINDLTTLSRAEQDSLGVDLNPLDPNELVRELATEYTDQAHAKDLAIIINVSDQVKPILTSRYRVKQVLQNFMTNAIKYTPSGTITIAVENAPIAHEGVVFSVSDTGIGLSVSDQKKVFTKFFRSEDYRTRESSGTGLGLYICSKLAERLNGKVWFESELKKGSTFYLQVPPYSQLKKDHTQVVKAEVESFFGAF